MSPERFTDAFLNDPVAKHARADFTTLEPEWTVGQALDHLRKTPPPGRVIYFYVVDAEFKLVGVVPTRRLLLSQPEAVVKEVMIRGAVAVPADATVLEACEFFTLHRFLALPVVDADRRLVGVIDVELYTDELAELAGGAEPTGAARDEVFQLIGVHLTAAQQVKPLTAFRGRFPWLLCNLGGGLLAAVLSGIYHDVLTWREAALAIFVPVVLALAESVAIQSVTLALQGLRAAPASWRRLVPRLAAEAGTGVLLGLASATLAAAAAAVWLRDGAVAIVLLGGIGVGVTAAAVIGLAVPYLLRLARRDPQVAAGPIALAAADFFTLLVYFNLARMMA
jgi:magnesium transporter